MMRVDLDLNLMRTLLVVAENKSLKRAGMRLGLTESAVSKQLASSLMMSCSCVWLAT